MDLNSELSSILSGLDRALGSVELGAAERSQLALCRAAVECVLSGRSVQAGVPARAEADEVGAVMIVEDDADFRAALERELAPAYRCLCFGDGESAMASLGMGTAVAALLVDYRLPGISGTAFLAEAARRFPLGGIPAIVMTSASEPAVEAEAYGSGGVNFVRKPCEPRDLRLRLDAAVRSAKAGEERARRMVRAKVERAMDSGEAPATPLDEAAFERFKLSPREVDVARLLAAGLQAKEIADGLGLSTHTVLNHIRNGYAKCGATNRVEFVRRLSRP